MILEIASVDVGAVAKTFGAVSAALLAWGAILRVFFQPVIQGYIIRIIRSCISDVHQALMRYMKEYPAEVDSTRNAWLERSRPMMANYVREILATDFAKAAERDHIAREALRMAEANSDRMEMLEAAIKAQGRSLSEIPRISEVIKTLNTTMERMNSSLDQIHNDVKGHANELGRVTGFLEAGGWDGNERRRSPRDSDNQR